MREGSVVVVTYCCCMHEQCAICISLHKLHDCIMVSRVNNYNIGRERQYRVVTNEVKGFHQQTV